MASSSSLRLRAILSAMGTSSSEKSLLRRRLSGSGYVCSSTTASRNLTACVRMLRDTTRYEQDVIWHCRSLNFNTIIIHFFFKHWWFLDVMMYNLNMLKSSNICNEGKKIINNIPIKSTLTKQVIIKRWKFSPVIVMVHHLSDERLGMIHLRPRSLDSLCHAASLRHPHQNRPVHLGGGLHCPLLDL